MKTLLPFLLPILVFVLSARAAEEPAARTLRSFGAVGDGKTDDRAAIQKALTEANGALVDGEGATYAVHGNIEVRVPTVFRNATLVQTVGSVDMSPYIPSAKGNFQIVADPPECLRGMLQGLPHLTAFGMGTYAEDPVLKEEDLKKVMPSIVLRTLTIAGSPEKAISVRLEKIKVMRGNNPDTGGRNDGAGLLVKYASPVDLTDIEVTGDGKGRGIGISDCSEVNLVRLNIHDMKWAPYRGDVKIPLSVVKNDFRWNNFPIYEYRVALNRFVRVRIQEQLSGLFVLRSKNVVIRDSKIHRLQSEIEGQLFPIQADGMTIGATSNLVIKNCDISFVWEGIDLTGGPGQDFVYDQIKTADTFYFGLKFAHDKSNGKITGCIAERSGVAGFIIGSKADNFQFDRCQALETGSHDWWTKGDEHFTVIAGFRLEREDGLDTPKRISLDNCTAINKTHPGAMDYGFYCEVDAKEHQISLKSPNVRGAKIQKIFGF